MPTPEGVNRFDLLALNPHRSANSTKRSAVTYLLNSNHQPNCQRSLRKSVPRPQMDRREFRPSESDTGKPGQPENCKQPSIRPAAKKPLATAEAAFRSVVSCELDNLRVVVFCLTCRHPKVAGDKSESSLSAVSSKLQATFSIIFERVFCLLSETLELT